MKKNLADGVRVLTGVDAYVMLWLDEWDNGNHVKSLEMGGIGPGYEQAIQVLAVELVRHGYPWSDEFLHSIVHQIDYIMSGTQVDCAVWLAEMLIKHGPDELWAKAKEHDEADRRIMISKSWPKLLPTKEPKK